MTKLTIEIDMDDPQEVWDALYRRIEDFDASDFRQDRQGRQDSSGTNQTSLPATYDLLLDPEQVFGDAQTFFGIFSRDD